MKIHCDPSPPGVIKHCDPSLSGVLYEFQASAAIRVSRCAILAVQAAWAGRPPDDFLQTRRRSPRRSPGPAARVRTGLWAEELGRSPEGRNRRELELITEHFSCSRHATLRPLRPPPRTRGHDASGRGGAGQARASSPAAASAAALSPPPPSRWGAGRGSRALVGASLSGGHLSSVSAGHPCPAAARLRLEPGLREDSDGGSESGAMQGTFKFTVTCTRLGAGSAKRTACGSRHDSGVGVLYSNRTAVA